ncbi:MAG: SUMF1/EgtB/PvdO family nonheme iron enzyme [Bacteroidales bacterium]|jgi:gliding motility-associated lipoprotein GldK|nr:gliding motility-associated lipoprotein GldK [Bacteroidales bacterium]MCR5362352.1 SUMF1/EgtB/PvdO family nonheme iron enzyme [Bacteroidales bacterium]
MKKILLITMSAIAVSWLGTSCSKSLSGGGGGEVTGVRGRAWNEPQPYGMVLIKRGSMEMGAQKQDSLWGDLPESKGISVDAFWMDEKEVSNAVYRQFVYYVRDSIIRERLADPAYGGNDEYKIEEDKYGEPITPHLNWSKPIPWRKPNEDEQRAIESVYKTDPITGKKYLDAKQMNYRFETFDYKSYAQRRYRLDPERRNLNTDVPVNYDELVMISKDTAYIDDEGNIKRETIERPLSSEYDFLNTYIVNIYPDTTVWVNDFANAFTEQYARYYFSSPIYDDYPVVGVSWEQANAFCAWRTEYLKQSYGMRGVDVEPFRLPTEAEWEYAARAGNNDQNYSWKTDVARSEKGCFNGNFKPGDGNYSKDGYIITSPVGAYSSNDFGLYDMSGNVAEWTSTAWSESGVHSAADINPDYQYNAAKEDPYRLKRKVIRGGSWKDASHYVRADVRTWEYQNEQRSFIGFRCVRTYLGNSKANVKTNAAKKSSKGSSSAPKQRQRPQRSAGGAGRSVRR